MKVNYSEYDDSQKPALKLLQKIGQKYLSPKYAFEAHSAMNTNEILGLDNLTDILKGT